MSQDTITSETVIDLGEGWELSFDNTRGDPGTPDALQGFLVNHKENRSASLNFALETGTDSDRDEEIPESVLDEARDYEEFA